MRKVKYFVANSLDNFIARPDGGVDWLFNDGTDYGMAEFFRSIDCVLLGPKTYEVAIAHNQPQRKSRKAKKKAGFSVGMKSYVFSRTLKADPKDDFTIVSKNAGAFVRKLKKEAGKDIWLMRGGELAGSLLGEGVVDQLSLNIHPVMLGEGIYKCFTEITDFVESEPKYERQHKSEFYRGADCWVIAHALADNGTVVTLETEREYGKIKVNSVCTKMKVRWIDVFTLQDKLDFIPADYRSEDEH